MACLAQIANAQTPPPFGQRDAASPMTQACWQS